MASLNVVSNGHHGVYCELYEYADEEDVWFETYNPSTNAPTWERTARRFLEGGCLKTETAAFTFLQKTSNLS